MTRRRKQNIYEALGGRTIINAKGPATRLSGGIMRQEVAAAMAEASRYCVDMAELQAAASKIIAGITGGEAGYVASGAAACLLIATAACIAGHDPGRMARLPDTRGLRNEVIMVRSQRNLYDHAVRAAGARIVEVGLPDRYAGAGVRDAEVWEIEDAIGERTAAIFYVADSNAQPPLRDVVAMARVHRIPVIVDAAARLPPQSNLRQFIAEGADLVAFSGGKAIGGPQASGILCGKRDLIMSAALQHLDLDVHSDMWAPPPSLIDNRKLKGVPQHGIGRTCKAGKEEIVGLLRALQLFVNEGDRARHANWCNLLAELAKALPGMPDVQPRILGSDDAGVIPVLELSFGKSGMAFAVASLLTRQTPAIHVDASRRNLNLLDINPVCLVPDDIPQLSTGLRRAIAKARTEKR
jgi:L-seryl-tRNA(Ser) seleniumtransferase